MVSEAKKNEELKAAEDQTSGEHAEQAADSQAAPPAQDLAEEVQKLREQLKEEQNRYLYLYSDFENHRRRSVKERIEAQKYGWEPAARELLETIDNIERALGHMPEGTDKALIDGLHMIMRQFLATLEKYGVKYIPALNQPFDPHFHEAIGRTPSEQPEGTVVEEQLKGYMLHDRLLRASRVVVSMGQPGGK